MTPDEIEKDRALERIWAEAPGVIDDMGFWQPNQSAGLEAYVRADLFDAVTAERDAALALVAAAYEAAASEVAPLLSSALVSKASAHTESFANAMGERADGLELSIRRIRALTPADALAAQAARDERMRAEGAREAEARNVKLANALRPFAKACDALISQAPDHRRLAFGGEILTYGDFRRARAALQENGYEC